MAPRYWSGPPVPLRRCLWSWRDGKVWKPVGSEPEEARIEQEYQDYQRYGRSVGTREGVGGPPPGRSARAP